jgi:pimeloyl-ACP methyl ester carboxylesterase
MDWAETSAFAARACAEVPVSFAGPAGTLCGIVTPPAPDARPHRSCIVFPARPRFAFRRLPVLASRILAASGFTVLRFDLRGSGESGGATEVESRHTPHGDDVTAAIGHLRAALGLQRFIVAGYCYDGLCALDAFGSEADAIDGLFCVAAPVTEEPIRISPIKKLTRGVRAPGAILSRMKDPRRAAQMLRSGGRIIASVGERQATPRVAPIFARGFNALADSQARALFLYGEDDPFRQEFAFAERDLFAQLPDQARSRLKIEIWPGVVHSTEMEPAIFERAIEWISELGSAAGS